GRGGKARNAQEPRPRAPQSTHHVSHGRQSHGVRTGRSKHVHRGFLYCACSCARSQMCSCCSIVTASQMVAVGPTSTCFPSGSRQFFNWTSQQTGCSASQHVGLSFEQSFDRSTVVPASSSHLPRPKNTAKKLAMKPHEFVAWSAGFSCVWAVSALSSLD